MGILAPTESTLITLATISFDYTHCSAKQHTVHCLFVGKIAKEEGSPKEITKEEGLCTGTAVNGPIVAVALASY